MTAPMTYPQIRAILEKVTYRDWRFELFDLAVEAEARPVLALRVAFNAVDTYTGKPEWQFGRYWVLIDCETEDDVLRTALLAILTAEEHEARENFVYQRKHIFGPHKRVAAAVA